VGDAWIKSQKCLPLILRYFVYINRVIEQKGASESTSKGRQKILKNLFDVVPVCDIRDHFVTMDISVLYGLMVDLKYVASGFKAFEELGTDQWRSFLHIDHLGGKDKDAKFTGTVDIDGTSICVHDILEVRTMHSWHARGAHHASRCAPCAPCMHSLLFEVHSLLRVQRYAGRSPPFSSVSKRVRMFIAALKSLATCGFGVRTSLEATIG